MVPTKTVLFLALSASLAACTGTQPSRFYQLTAPSVAGSPAGAAARRVVGLEKLDFPDYLDRPEMVLRSGGSRLRVLEYDRWGGTLESMATRALAQHLAAELKGMEIVELPLNRSFPLSHAIEVAVDRFDADETGGAVLEARWRVFGREGERLDRLGRTVAQEPVATPGDPGAVADALSRTLARLARDIAGAVR